MSEQKGKFQGLCNRSACLAPGATWHNAATDAYYCERCASRINAANAGHRIQNMPDPLCTEDAPNPRS